MKRAEVEWLLFWLVALLLALGLLFLIAP